VQDKYEVISKIDLTNYERISLSHRTPRVSSELVHRDNEKARDRSGEPKVTSVRQQESRISASETSRERHRRIDSRKSQWDSTFVYLSDTVKIYRAEFILARTRLRSSNKSIVAILSVFRRIFNYERHLIREGGEQGRIWATRGRENDGDHC